MVTALFWSNVPFFMVGPIIALPGILLFSFWLSLTWEIREHYLFTTLKSWFIGFFCLALVDLARKYPLMQQEGPKAFTENVLNFLVFSLIPLTFFSLTLGFIQWINLKLYRKFEFLDEKTETLQEDKSQSEI